jgi:hypothetical protein
MKKHIKNFNTFLNENYKTSEKIEEGLFSWLKDKIMMGISKKIGGASKLDKLAMETSKKLETILDKKINLEKELSIKKEAFDNDTNNPQLKKAYELKQKAYDGQISALNKQEDALDKNFKIQAAKIVGKNNPRLSQYLDAVTANMDMQMSSYSLKKYEELDLESEEIAKKEEKMAASKAKKEAALQALKDADIDKKNQEEIDRDTAHLDLKVGSIYLYYSKKAKKDIKVKLVSLLKKPEEKVDSVNGKMVRVLSLLSNTEFRVEKTSLKPLTVNKVASETDTSQDTVVVDQRDRVITVN